MKSLFNILVFGFVVALVAVTFGAEIYPTAVGLTLYAGVVACYDFFNGKKQETGLAYMAIPIQDARALFTKMLVAVYREKVSTTGFLRSFFVTKEAMTKEISIEVQRGFEKVAVDVERGTDGNRNKFSLSTEKTFVPPFYWEYLTANEHRLYDVAIGMQNSNSFTQMTAELAEQLFQLKNKIERAYEVQCAQVLETGIVQLNAGVNINYKRKAASLVDLTATPWTNSANDPYKDLETGAKFIRQVGKSQGSVYNVILGSEALNAFLNNDNVKERADIRNFKLDNVREPQRNSTGGTLHGEVSAGSYSFRLWTYPEYYDNASGVSTPYINPKKIIILPENPNFVLTFGLVPQLISDKGTVAQNGAYLIQDFIDERATAHETHIKSAGVAIPVAVDQIWTGEVVA